MCQHLKCTGNRSSVGNLLARPKSLPQRLHLAAPGASNCNFCCRGAHPGRGAWRGDDDPRKIGEETRPLSLESSPRIFSRTTQQAGAESRGRTFPYFQWPGASPTWPVHLPFEASLGRRLGHLSERWGGGRLCAGQSAGHRTSADQSATSKRDVGTTSRFRSAPNRTTLSSIAVIRRSSSAWSPPLP